MTMNPNEYQELARRTAAHNPRVPEEFHWALGIMGEYHEIAEVYRRAVIFELHYAQVDLAAEVGDVLWYLSQLATAYEIPFSDCIPDTDNLSAPRTDFENKYLLDLVFYISALMERVKKVSFYKKDHKPIDPSEIKNVVAILAFILKFSSLKTLEDCMAANIAKLQARYPDKFNG
jgi:NTP pyrophosphatase (non-canonical NTP hydrolase)